MTLIDALAALQEGALPTNQQTIAFLRSLAPPPSERGDGTKQTSRLVGDLQTVLDDLLVLIKERNGDEELQEFLWRTGGVAGQIGHDGLRIRFGKDEEAKRRTKEDKKKKKTKPSLKERARKTEATMKSNATTAVHHLRALTKLLVVQPELRHIIADFGYMFAEVVDKSTGQSIAEARQEFDQVKSTTGTMQSIADRAFAASQAQKVQPRDVVSNLGSAPAKGEGSSGAAKAADLDEGAKDGTVVMQNLSSLREQLSATLSGPEISLEAVRDELANGPSFPSLQQLRTRALTSAGKAAVGWHDVEKMQPRANDDAPVPFSEIENGLMPTDLVDAAQMVAVGSKRFHLAPGATRDLAQQSRDNVVKNFSEAWTEERQRRMLNRLKKLCIDCQSSKDYKEALVWFIDCIEELATTMESKMEMPHTTMDVALSEASEPLIQLLENFSNGQSLRSILQTIRALSLGAKEDPNIAAFWKDADAHLRRCLLEDGYILLVEAETGTRDLIERFRTLEQDYRRRISQLVGEVKDFVESIRNDVLLLKVLNDIKQVSKDLFVGKDGKLLPSKQLWYELRSVILPALLEKFGILPVPRIKYLHPDFDIVIENVALELKHLLPNILDVKMTNDVHFDFEKIKSSTHEHSLKIKFKGMSLRVHQLAFALTSRLGFTFHDRGIADLLVANFGLSIYLDVPKDPGPHYFIVRKVKVKLPTLQLKVHKSNHRILHAMAGALASSYLTKLILRHFIAEGVTLGLKQLDVQLMAARLSKDGEEGKLDLVEVRRQLAELRDLLRKYHEQAGTLEIDFKGIKGADIKGVGRSIEESHAVKWVKKQVDETGRKEIVRNQWRSNAFDIEGTDTIRSPPPGANQAAREAKKKPEGSTTETTVRKADKELQAVAAQEEPRRAQLQVPQSMDSEVGKMAVRSKDRNGQIAKLEEATERH